MKIPGLGSSPPKNQDPTPDVPTPQSKALDAPSTPANGGSNASDNFRNVASGTGDLASGGASVYRAAQQSAPAEARTQGAGAISYGSESSSSAPPAMQNRAMLEQGQGLSRSESMMSMLLPLTQMLAKLLSAMAAHSGAGSNVQQGIGGSKFSEDEPDIEINIQLPGSKAAEAPAVMPEATPLARELQAHARPPVEGAQALPQPKPPLESEKDTSTKPTGPTGRPKGDNRSAEEIIAANPILANLGHQKDIRREDAYKVLGHGEGGWTEANKDPEARADAAYDAARVLNYIDASYLPDGRGRGKQAGNGDLEGLTHRGDARHGTPAGNWLDFTKYGYSALKDDHRLDTTKDSHVRDGANMDELPWLAGQAGKALWFIPPLSNVLTGIGDSDGSVGGMLKGGFEGAVHTAEGALGGLVRGGGNPLLMATSAYMGALSETEAAPEEVRKIAGML